MQNRTCAGAAAFLVTALAITHATWACAWDRDTLLAESQNWRDPVPLLVGWVERNPPLYYRMRFERTQRELETHPDRLDLYGDAAVAADRLGESTLAIDIMAAKKAMLDKLSASPDAHFEHRYRYLANLGTFHAHRWFRGGQNRDDMADLRQARDLIAAAIELNPDAHFGREKYQLMAIEWYLGLPDELPAEWVEMQDGNPMSTTFVTGLGRMPPIWLSDDDMRAWSAANKRLDREDVYEGIAGLIVLGGAFESPMVYEALSTLFASRMDTSLALMADMRMIELRDSVSPDDPQRHEKLNKAVGGWGRSTNRAAVVDAFIQLRDEADAWHAHRTTFMMAQLEQGKHPDTHPSFWDGYREPKMTNVAAFSPIHKRVIDAYRFHPVYAIAMTIAGLALAVGVHRAIRCVRVRRSADSPALPAA